MTLSSNRCRRKRDSALRTLICLHCYSFATSMSWCGKALTGLAFAVSADAPLNLRSYKLFVSQHVFLCPFSFFTSHWQCHSRTSFSKTVFLDNLEFGTYTSELGESIGRIPCFKPYSGTFSEAVENSNDLNFAILLFMRFAIYVGCFRFWSWAFKLW